MAGDISLRERLRAEDPRLRLAALEKLTAAPDASYRGDLVRICMDDREAPCRLQAARALAAWWPDAQVIRAYAARVTDEFAVSGEIVALLGKFADPRAADILEKVYDTATDPRVKLKVLGNFHGAGEARVLEFLKKTAALDDPDERIRASAVALLARLENPRGMRAVVHLLQDKAPRVRANALEALGARYAGVGVARVMAQFVSDKHHRVRSVAIKFLLLYGVSSAEHHLQRMVESSDHLCRAAAAWVMREVPRSGTMAEWIAKLAGDASEMVAAMAQAAAAARPRPAMA